MYDKFFRNPAQILINGLWFAASMNPNLFSISERIFLVIFYIQNIREIRKLLIDF